MKSSVARFQPIGDVTSSTPQAKGWRLRRSLGRLSTGDGQNAEIVERCILDGAAGESRRVHTDYNNLQVNQIMVDSIVTKPPGRPSTV